MKLGMLTAPFPLLSLDEIAAWASESGFEMLEVACWPLDAVDHRDRSAHIDVESLTKAKSDEIREMLASRRLGIASLGYYSNHLHPDQHERDRNISHLKKVFLAAEMLDVPVVGTFLGRDPSMTLEQSLELFAEVWPPVVEFAADHGVRVAIENCPMTVYHPRQWPGGENLASTPYVWQRMWEIIPDENFGLTLDPSHLVLQMIDYIRPIKEFKDRIFHVHAKDERIDREKLYLNGAFDLGKSWHVPSVPGLGDIDWGRFIGELYAAGYDDTVSVELEDATFEREDYEWRKRGLLIGRDVLRPLIK